MKNINKNNDIALTALAFGFVGFVLLVGIMVFHQPINAQLTLEKDNPTIVGLESKSIPVPDEVIQEITRDQRNILGYASDNLPSEPMTPAMKFLYTISSENLFLTQK